MYNIIITNYLFFLICSTDWDPKRGVWIGATSYQTTKDDFRGFDILTSLQKSSYFRWPDGTKVEYSSK